MLTKRERQLSAFMILIQIILSLIVFLSIQLFFHETVFNQPVKSLLMIQILVIWYFCFQRFKLGIIFRTIAFIEMVRGYFITICIGTILFMVEIELISSFYPIESAHKYLIYFSICNFFVLIAYKYLFYNSMAYIRRRGHNTRHALIIADTNSIPFLEAFYRSKDWGFRICAIFSSDNNLAGKYAEVKVTNNIHELTDYIQNNAVDDIFYTISSENAEFSTNQLIKYSKAIGVTLHIMQSEYLLKMRSGKLKKNFTGTFKTYQSTPEEYFWLKIKDSFDWLFSLLIIIAVSPIMLLIALLIKMEDGGSVFFKQERIGLNGRKFYCLKFRSMIPEAEALRAQLAGLNESDGPTFKMENDPRITRIGRFIRKTSLDELPQFFNVLKNDMSIVGPRPPLHSEVLQYEQSQIRRLSMKPGITCIWQVWGRNSVSFKEWMQMDLKYIDNWSIWLDLKIIAATVLVVFKANGR